MRINALEDQETGFQCGDADDNDEGRCILFYFLFAKFTWSLPRRVIYMRKKLTKTQVEEQRLCYAVKACHMMGFDAEKAADLLETEIEIVTTIYAMIEKDMIDFNSK